MNDLQQLLKKKRGKINDQCKGVRIRKIDVFLYMQQIYSVIHHLIDQI